MTTSGKLQTEMAFMPSICLTRVARATARTMANYRKRMVKFADAAAARGSERPPDRQKLVAPHGPDLVPALAGEIGK